MAEQYESFSPYNYTLNNPAVNIDPDGRSVSSFSSENAILALLGWAKGEAALECETCPKEEEKEGGGSAEKEKEKKAEPMEKEVEEENGLTKATKTALSAIALDVSTLEPSDAVWYKWVGYATAGGLAVTYLYFNSEKNLGFGDPKKWHYTFQHPSQNPIHNPPQGFDPENPPDWKGPVGWMIRAGLTYKLYDEYKSHINKLPPIPLIAPRDNTNVSPKFYPYKYPYKK